MMLPTHVVVGLAVAAPIGHAVPELAPAALLGVFVGSVLPDLDLYAGHRRTLHFPTGYSVIAAVAGVAAIVWPAPALVAAAFLALGAALHCRMDRYGGGLELQPWKNTSDRAVYDHVRGRWRAPKRWIRYDGAPEDLALAAVVGLVPLSLLGGGFRGLVAGALVVAVVYAALRRRLAAVAPVAFGRLPDRLGGYVPDRYRG